MPQRERRTPTASGPAAGALSNIHKSAAPFMAFAGQPASLSVSARGGNEVHASRARGLSACKEIAGFLACGFAAGAGEHRPESSRLGESRIGRGFAACLAESLRFSGRAAKPFILRFSIRAERLSLSARQAAEPLVFTRTSSPGRYLNRSKGAETWEAFRRRR